MIFAMYVFVKFSNKSQQSAVSPTDSLLNLHLGTDHPNHPHVHPQVAWGESVKFEPQWLNDMQYNISYTQ